MKHATMKVAVMLTVALAWMSLDVKQANACGLLSWLFGCRHHRHCDDYCYDAPCYDCGCGYDHGFHGGCGYDGGCGFHGDFGHGHHGFYGALPAAPAPLAGPQIATCSGPHCENVCSGPDCGCATISTCCGPQASSSAFQLASFTSGN